MRYFECKKVRNMIAHSWIKQVLERMMVADTVCKVIEIIILIMNNWETTVETLEGNTPGNINIRRGIFQGDFLLLPLLAMSISHLTILIRRVKYG